MLNLKINPNMASTRQSVLSKIKTIIAKGRCAEHFDVDDKHKTAICINLLHDDGDFYSWLTFNIGGTLQDAESNIRVKMGILQDKVNELSIR